MQNEVRCALARRAFCVIGHGVGVKCSRIHIEAGAWLDHIDDNQADNEGECGNDLKVEKSFAANPSDLLHVAGSSNAQDDRAKDHRTDQHLDEGNEAVAKRFEFYCGGGIDVAEDPPAEDGE